MSAICLGHHPVAGCGAMLTAEERHYYGVACEKCEREWSERMRAYRRGVVDPELDAMFSCPPPVSH